MDRNEYQIYIELYRDKPRWVEHEWPMAYRNKPKSKIGGTQHNKYPWYFTLYKHNKMFIHPDSMHFRAAINFSSPLNV